MYRTISFIFLFLRFVTAFALDPDSIKPYSKLKVELDYSSDNSFMGRKNLIKIPMLAPLVKYTHKSGFFTEASAINTKNKSKQLVDELDAGAGWMFDFSEKWDGSVSYSHYFYNSSVSRLKSSLQSDLNMMAGFDWNILYSRLTADYYIGKLKSGAKKKAKARNSNDYNITLANMHDFDIDLTKNSTLTISPEADVLFGTQNFLATYKGKADTSLYKKQASAAAITSYIFYLDIKYRVKNLSLLFSPSYTIPQNVPSGESSTPYFIVSASVYYTFKYKKTNK